MKKIMKVITVMLVMVMVLTGATPTVTEAKTTKTSITVINKSTDKKVGKTLTLTQGKKLQLKVKYGKTNVTKKAKYKASNKNVAVNKKGKITAKKAGTTTVTIKYKKKTKKIKVTVKTKTTVNKTTNDSTTNQSQDSDHEPIVPRVEYDYVPADKYIEARKQNYIAPHPECEHEWTLWFYSATDSRTNQLDTYTLYRLHCPKCGTVGYTDNTLIARDALKCTNEELTGLIQYYEPKTVRCQKKHQHVYHWEWTYYKNTGMWFGGRVCDVCGDD